MGRRRVDELRNLDPCLLIHGSRFLCQRMNAAMNVGVRATVELIHRLDDRQRLLGGRSGIKINQRNARLGLALENGKIVTDFFYIEGHVIVHKYTSGQANAFPCLPAYRLANNPELPFRACRISWRPDEYVQNSVDT